MGGLSSTLEIAKSTLLSEQVHIQVTSHNIANADNKAYARQRAVQVTNPATITSAGWVGNGARITRITQDRDQWVEGQLMGSVSREFDFKTRASLLASIGSYLKDDGDSGLSSDLGEFWNSWDMLSQSPGGMSERNGVLSASKALTQTLRTRYGDLASLSEDVKDQTASTVSQINALLARVADYNKTITKLESTQRKANDLRDLRHQALMDLSKLVHIDSTEQANGSVLVSLTDGANTVDLVSDQYSGKVQYDRVTQSLSYVDAYGNAVSPVSNSLAGGSLNGLLYALGKTNEYMVHLDTFATALISAVNGLHDTPPVFEGTSAGDIQVSGGFQVLANIDGTKALGMADLQNQGLSDLGGARLSEYLAGIQQGIGLDQQEALSRGDFNEALVLELEAHQQSVSGVSIDEEMIELLKHQQIYQAAAKVATTANEMLKTTIEMV